MKNKQIKINGCVWCFILFLLTGCQTSTQERTDSNRNISGKNQLIFLDSTEACSVIVVDKEEGFFDKVGVTDMLIQMKRPFVDSLNRAQLLDEYKNFLRTEVTNFTEEEQEFCQRIMSRIETELGAIHPDLFPKPLRLIKLHGNHYGAGAFYTRENAILIPKQMLARRNAEGFYETMLHEIFHIYSRYHPKEKAALYELIGFKSIGSTDHLQMDEVLRSRILLNPDGINYAYAITIEDVDRSLSAIPLIVARARGYEADKSEFFDYLNFNLYPIRPPYSRLIKVECQNDGSSRLNIKEISGFYEQIQRNTNYIIHPDEILADNFIFMVKATQDARVLGQFTEEGQELIEAMMEVMKKN